MSSCIHHCPSHHYQVRLPHRAGAGSLGPPRPAAASFALPSCLRRAARARAMSAEAPPGVAPAEPGPSATAAVLSEMVEDAAVWCAVHGLVVGDRDNPRSGTVPGVGLVHAPFSLLPARLPTSVWKQALELAPIFNELVDRVSLDGEFLQEALSRTKQVDDFTARLLEIHQKMMAVNKKEDIRLGLHRSDYMLDSETNSLLQIELNTISISFPGLGSLVSELHRNLLIQYGKVLGLDSERIPRNWAASQFADALARAWSEYNNDRDGRIVSVVYFRAGYAPNDYPSEAEWRARLLMEQSSAIKCPSISYHLVGTKKIQQELAKPNVLERFLDNKEDIAKLRKSFAGLWSLDNEEIVKSAIEKPELFVLKPQREGGGNNIYGHDLRDTLVKLQKEQGESLAAYILMQRIFPKASLTPLVRGGVCFEDLTISELGIFGGYLRNKDRVIMNNPCGYLMRTKVSSSNEGGVATGFAVLDSVYLTDEVAEFQLTTDY
ncbi:hypothetical protein PR202_gb13595 [Eleusine coracana subsp. coracana]|uniref:Glutathione synthetase n=1 Tax=Eleusine coracana subsp. coracana TaxID=191504 RepID=A0AAV5ESU4_ELECO|nr:hypothetical protein PR202_gb13595 [Eleusine coracana subsp. coracana]